ncbi:MAG: DUF6152 family protein [Gammaproteobacteria bacterium]|nr:DUF6152 family protein [Gammaproteobacteria bacterium]
MIRKPNYLSLFTTLILFVGFPATAHHNGATYFDLSTELEHTDATVVSYDLVNPHGRLVYVYMDDEGDEMGWSAELPSANNARRRGLSGDLFQPGDKLTTLSGSPSRSGANFMRLTRVVFANGDVAQITGRNAGVVRAGIE